MESSGETPPGPASRRTRIGDFVLLEEIGRGGMGVVYRARQESMSREVALKILVSFAGMEPAAVARFRREAGAAGRLSHPGIVPVYAVGETDGTHYFAMELVEGPTLADLLERLQGRLPERLIGSLAEETGYDRTYPNLKDPPGDARMGERYARSCAAVIADVANALACAHRSGIIHRDVKPSNVLIHPSGRPVLVDFGLAREESAPGLTRSGDAMGTPSYMSPEQALGRSDIDHRCDVYGLGATLYEMLALEPPFGTGSPGEIMRRILDEDVVSVSRRNSKVPAELGAILRTSLAKEPDDRYATMEALELDLRAYLSGRAVAARKMSRGDRVRRVLKRQRKAVVATLVTLLIAATLTTTMAVVSGRRSRRAGMQALERARTELVEHRDYLQAKEYYGRAEVLLADPALVQEARLRHFQQAFAALYGDTGSHAVLEQAWASLTEAQTRQLAEERSRLNGRGRLRLVAAEDGGSVPMQTSLREFRNGRLASDWHRLPRGGWLPIGVYLLRISREGQPDLVQRVSIQRDEEVVVRLPSWASAELPPDMSLVQDGAGGLAVARTELTRGEYAAFLRSLADPELVAEMQPVAWAAQRTSPANLPVTGLSHAQARVAAAHMHAHLPSLVEYEQAATAGLKAMRYPWGGPLEQGAIAADPDHLAGPQAAAGYERGASPHGILHLLGNVAEILAPGADGRLWLAGGHFQSRPEELDLRERARFLEAVPDELTSRRYAGMRLARFLPTVSSAKLLEAVAKRRRRLLASVGAAILHDWDLGEEGQMSYTITMSGNRSRGGRELSLPLVTRGFEQIGEPVAKDGYGRAIAAHRRPAPGSGGEVSRLEVRFDQRYARGQGYRLALANRLVPMAGLRGDGDGYVLRVPIKIVGLFPTMHQVRLPEGCRVDMTRVEPRPDLVYHQDRRPVLLWEFAADHKGSRTIPAVIPFTRDGLLTDRWPIRRRMEDFTARFLTALEKAGTAGLAPLLDADFLELPSGASREELLAGRGRNERHEVFGSPRLLHVRAVGSVVTADVRVDWTIERPGARPFSMNQWQLRLQARRTSSGFLAVRLLPAGRPDSGRIEDGVYRHAALKVRLQPPSGVTLSRGQDDLADMQVTLVEEGGYDFRVLGYYARPNESRDEIRARLTGAADLLREGRSLAGSSETEVGPPDKLLRGHDEHWLFGGGSRGGWSRERWTFFDRGARHFLIKALVRGASAAEVQRGFAARKAWFARMSERLEVD